VSAQQNNKKVAWFHRRLVSLSALLVFAIAPSQDAEAQAERMAKVSSSKKKEAAKKPSKADLKAAKKAYLKAQKLFSADEYKLALPLFQEAYRLSGGKPSAIMGLAQCERMLRMFDSAIGHFNELLATKPKPKIVKRVNETLAILNAQKAQAKLEAQEEEQKRVAAEKAADEKRRQEQEALAARLKEEIVVPAQNPFAAMIESPWFWVAAGAVAIGAGGGIYYATRPDIYNGTTDTVFGP